MCMLFSYSLPDSWWNVGDGTGEHPTQALLDIYTIKSELGVLGSTDHDKPMIVTLLGDLKNGRTVHSLVRLLAQFPNVKLVYVAPSVLVMPTEIIAELAALGVDQTSALTLNEAIKITDVLYVTRIQKERWLWMYSQQFNDNVCFHFFLFPSIDNLFWMKRLKISII